VIAACAAAAIVVGVVIALIITQHHPTDRASYPESVACTPKASIDLGSPDTSRRVRLQLATTAHASVTAWVRNPARESRVEWAVLVLVSDGAEYESTLSAALGSAVARSNVVRMTSIGAQRLDLPIPAGLAVGSYRVFEYLSATWFCPAGSGGVPGAPFGLTAGSLGDVTVDA
jgi:hypothetical protein